RLVRLLADAEVLDEKLQRLPIATPGHLFQAALLGDRGLAVNLHELPRNRRHLLRVARERHGVWRSRVQEERGPVHAAVVAPLVAADERVQARRSGTLEQEFDAGVAHRLTLADHAGQVSGVDGVVAEGALAWRLVARPLVAVVRLVSDHEDQIYGGRIENASAHRALVRLFCLRSGPRLDSLTRSDYGSVSAGLLPA